MDAVTKCNHFKKCGQATKSVHPLINKHLNAAEAEIRQLVALAGGSATARASVPPK